MKFSLVMLRSLVISIPVGLTIFDCIGYIAKVEGTSMQPLLNPDQSTDTDFVLLDRWHSKHYLFNRGEVVSFISPKDPSQRLIKRIIGLEGDVVKTLGYKRRYCKIPPGHCWVEGDNTGSSLDSNIFGPIAIGLITAKASRIVWPPNRWTKIEPDLPGDRIPVNLKEKTRSILDDIGFTAIFED